MPSELFRDARLKVKRANQHINELQRVLADFRETDFYRVVVEDDLQTGRSMVVGDMAKAMPECVPAIIGDAAHNLHATLDLVAHEVVALNGGSDKQVEAAKFPFREKRKELVTAFPQGPINIAGADIRDLILDEIRPHKDEGGNLPLYALHDLDILDKHQALVPVLAVTALMDFHAEDQYQNGVEGPITNVMVVGRWVLFDSHDKIEIKSHGKPTIDIFFGKGQPFEYEPVIPTLLRLSQYLTTVVNQFEQTLLARTQGTGHTPPTSGSHPPST